MPWTTRICEKCFFGALLCSNPFAGMALLIFHLFDLRFNKLHPKQNQVMRLMKIGIQRKKNQSESNMNGWKCKTCPMKDKNLSEVSEQHQRVMRHISERNICFFPTGIKWKSDSGTLAALQDCVSSITLSDVNENETWKINHNAIQWPDELTCVTASMESTFNIHELIKFQVFASRYEVLQCQQLYCCERITDYVYSIPNVSVARIFSSCLCISITISVFVCTFFLLCCCVCGEVQKECHRNGNEFEIIERKKHCTKEKTIGMFSFQLSLHFLMICLRLMR